MVSVPEEAVEAAAANHGYGYQPRYAACTGYRAGMNFCPDFHSPDSGGAVLSGEVVGVADVTLGFWLKMASNYPSLLSRIVAEKLQYEPGPEVYMVLGAIYSPGSLFVTPLIGPGELDAGKEGVRYGRPA
jgi:hypothetical protein